MARPRKNAVKSKRRAEDVHRSLLLLYLLLSRLTWGVAADFHAEGSLPPASDFDVTVENALTSPSAYDVTEGTVQTPPSATNAKASLSSAESVSEHGHNESDLSRVERVTAFGHGGSDLSQVEPVPAFGHGGSDLSQVERITAFGHGEWDLLGVEPVTAFGHGGSDLSKVEPVTAFGNGGSGLPRVDGVTAFGHGGSGLSQVDRVPAFGHGGSGLSQVDRVPEIERGGNLDASPEVTTTSFTGSHLELLASSPLDVVLVENLTFAERLVWYHEFMCNSPDVDAPLRSGCPLCYTDQQCFYFGDCCPRVFLKVPNATINTPYSCPEYFPTLNSYYMTASCPPSYDVREVTRKCKSPGVEDWQEQVPVTDMRNQVTYRNKFCAHCNGVAEFRTWTISAHCKDFNLVTDSKAEELFDLAMAGLVCAPQLLPPEGVQARECSPVRDPLITTCNFTGKWQSYDERLVRACASFRAPFRRYGNVFCRLCNSNARWSVQPPGKLIFSDAVTAILNLGDNAPIPLETEQDTEASCGVREFFDLHTCKCRPQQCPQGMTLRKDSCVSDAFEKVSFGYDVNVDITVTSPLEDLHLLGFYVRNMSTILENRVQTTLKRFLLNTVSVVAKSVTCSDNVVSELSGNIKLTPTALTQLDTAVSALLDIFRQFTVNLNGSTGLVRAMGKLSLESDFEFDVVTDYRGCKGYKTSWKNSIAFSHLYREEKSIVSLQLSPLLICPAVFLLAEEFVLSDETNTLTIVASNSSFVPSGIFSEDSGLRLCVDDYLSVFAESDDKSPCSKSQLRENTGSVSSTTEGILSFACTIVSLSFLALTLAVFAFFKELRTTSGKCAMCMLAALFLAQAVFEFGAEQTQTAGLCVALGVLTHYLWLSATFWMNACTVLLFYRLAFPLHARLTLQSHSRVLLLTSLYACLSPALVVASAMAANFSVHGDLGYGGAICYVSRATTRELAVALPIGVLVLVNLVLFLVTVVRLRRERRPTCSRKSRVGLLACVRLSVLTGLSWLALFLHESGPRLQVLQYLAIVFFGLQGVVVFASLVLNRHVLGLLRERFPQKPQPSSSSTVIQDSFTGKTAVESTSSADCAVTTPVG